MNCINEILEEVKKENHQYIGESIGELDNDDNFIISTDFLLTKFPKSFKKLEYNDKEEFDTFGATFKSGSTVFEMTNSLQNDGNEFRELYIPQGNYINDPIEVL